MSIRGRRTQTRPGVRRGTIGLKVAVLLGATLLSGCAVYNGVLNAAGYTSGSAKELHVPYERQSNEYLCGLAAADMVSRYYRAPLDAAARHRLEDAARHNGGISGRLLESVFRDAGYTAFLYSGSLDDTVTGLYWHLDRRRPLIVMYARHPNTPGHYVVVSGYDPARDTLIVLDPAQGRGVVSRRRFARAWAGSDRFTLLVVPTSKTAEE